MSDSDFLTWDLSEIPDQTLLEDGPYLFTIKKTAMKDAKTGRKGFYCMLLTDEVPNHRPVFNSLWFPMKGDDESKALIMLTMMKTFFDAAEYDYSAITSPAALEEHLGELEDLQVRASVGTQPADEQEGTPAQNTIKAWLNK